MTQPSVMSVRLAPAEATLSEGSRTEGAHAEGRPASGFDVGRGEGVALVPVRSRALGELVEGIAGLEPVEGAEVIWSDITSRELWTARGSAAQYRLSRRVRLQVGLISATASLLQNQTLFDNIALPVRYHLSSPEATVVEAVNALMDALEIRELAGRRPAGLPRGACWKAELARALVLDPAVLIIQSPLDGVDAESRGQILKLLRRRREEDGMAVVVAGPDVVPFLPVIDRALVLEGRRVIGAIPRASLEDPRIFTDRARLLEGLERSA